MDISPKALTAGALLLASVALTSQASAVTSPSEENPVADQAAIVVTGNTRFTVLTPRMIRIEHSPEGIFEDRATFAIRNRRLPVPLYSVADSAGVITLRTQALTLRYRKGTDPRAVPSSPANLSVTMLPLPGADTAAVWYPGKSDPLNLLGTCRTLDCSNGSNKLSEMEPGIVSRSGWAVVDDSWSNVRPDGSRSFAMQPDSTLGYDWWAPRADPQAMDIYFFGYGHDYTDAIADFTRVAGRIPLPPAYVFGYWYSKYDAYSSDDFRAIMADLESNSIPADVMIVDMDWHWNGDSLCGSAGRGGWTGWSWNTNLIPDARQMLADMHDRRFKVALNLHPALGINETESPAYHAAMRSDLAGRYGSDTSDIAWSLDYPDFTRSFFSRIIRDHESEGVDFWWLDWQQHLTSPYTPGLGQTFWCNHVFFNDMKHNRPSSRPVIFHRWGGLGSHRYQIGFSGDTFINFPTLAFQPWFTATAANVGYAYWGHDLGGHAIGDPDEWAMANDPELVLRWIQFGVFTPIFRTHATKDPRIERRMWKFPNFPSMLQAVRLRYSLFPYIYTMARKTYDTGIALCRPLYYSWPEVPEAYSYKGQYMFGDDIMVAPVTEPSPDGTTSPKEIWFPEGEWYDVARAEIIQGPAVRTISYTLDQIPRFYRAGAVIPLNPDSVTSVLDRPSGLRLEVVSGASATASVYEDLGDNPDYHGTFAITPVSHTFSSSAAPSDTIHIAPRQGHHAGLPAT
ncbi:MAG: glycoside hydrolase family 31 protein, partial [Muribaculaceae bacterium]|nr:glycoside hydrolase family 31 protein [Muribaculaceae bacterium]